MPLSQRIIRSSIDWSGSGIRLADYLAGRFTYRSRTEWEERIRSGEITVNGRIVPPETLLELHDLLEYRPGELPEPPAELHYRTVFEDDHLLVLDKPGNLCMHPSGPFYKHTLWYLLKEKYGAIHFVSRLDRETGGLLAAAKTPECAKRLSAGRGDLRKRYAVLVHGDFPEGMEAEGFLSPAGSIIRKKRRFTRERPDHPPFESARTVFRRIASGNGLSLLSASLDTGRMHQIRATLWSLGYPVAGDKLYGRDEKLYLKQRENSLTDADRELLMLPRQALQSVELSFIHPVSGERMTFTSPIPEIWTERMK